MGNNYYNKEPEKPGTACCTPVISILERLTRKEQEFRASFGKHTKF